MGDDPKTDPLAEAAVALCAAVKRCAPDGCDHVDDHLIGPQRRLLAALAARLPRPPRRIQGYDGQSVACEHWYGDDGEPCGDACRLNDPDPNEDPWGDAGESGVLRDPEPPTPCDDCETTGQNCRAHSAPIWRQHPSAEGGQPDADDEPPAFVPLYSDDAKVEILLAKVEEGGSQITRQDIADLASALRRKRDELAEAETWQSAWEEEAYKNKRLERELAKARERTDEWERIAANYRRGTVTVTDGMLDSWIESLRSGNAVVFGPPEANGLADRLAETRSGLQHINRHNCERFTHGSCLTDPSLSRDAEYGADQWCDPCIAADALGKKENSR